MTWQKKGLVHVKMGQYKIFKLRQNEKKVVRTKKKIKNKQYAYNECQTRVITEYK